MTQSNMPLRLATVLLVGSLSLPTQAANVEDRLAKLERLLQSQGLVQLLNQVDELQLELQRLRGEVEFQTHTLEQIKKRQRDLYIDIDRRLQSVETQGTANTIVDTTVAASGSGQLPADGNPPLQVLHSSPAADLTGTPGEPAASPLTVEVQVPEQAATQTPAATTPPPAVATTETIVLDQQTGGTDPQLAEARYKEAFELLKTGQHDAAMQQFASFIETYPDSSYAANAQYWLGEAYYVKQRFDEAIAEFRLLVQNYPDSQKVTRALLKIGYSLHELKRYDEAIKVLQDLKTRYPSTSAAGFADQRLQRINTEYQASPAANSQG